MQEIQAGLSATYFDGRPFNPAPNTKDVEVWRNSLANALKTSFKREDGAIMSLSMAFVDGGWASEYVYAFFQWLKQESIPGVIEQQWWIAQGPGSNGSMPPDVEDMLEKYRVPVVS